MTRDEARGVRHSSIFWSVGTLVAVVGLVYVVDAYVDRKIDRALSSPAYLTQVAARVRPSLVFTSGERIVADMGGRSRVDTLRVFKTDEGLPERILVVTKEWNGLAPILTGADETLYEIHERQGARNRWEYDVEPIMHRGSESDGPPKRAEHDDFRFRLEFMAQLSVSSDQ